MDETNTNSVRNVAQVASSAGQILFTLVVAGIGAKQAYDSWGSTIGKAVKPKVEVPTSKG